MNNSSDGPSRGAKLHKHWIKSLTDPAFRLGWIVRVVLLVAATAILLWGWWADTGDSYRVGAPAPRTYVALYTMSFEDREATDLLRQRVASEVAAVLVKDGLRQQELEDHLRLLAGEGGVALLPPSLAELLLDFPEGRRKALLEVAQTIGLELIAKNNASLMIDGDDLWVALEATGLDWADRNVVYQMLDSLLEPTIRIDEEATVSLRARRSQAVQPVERVLRSGETIAEKGEVVTPQQAVLLSRQGYPERHFPWRHFLFALFIVLIWSFWPDFFVFRHGLLLDRREWLFFVVLVGTGWFCQALGRRLGIDGVGVLPLAGWAYLTLPRNFALHLVLGAGTVGSLLALDAPSFVTLLIVMTSVAVAGLGYFLLHEVRSRVHLWQQFFLVGLGGSAATMLGRWWMGLDVGLELAGIYVLASAVIAMVVIAVLPLWENLFDVISPLRLIELSHPANRLLKRLQVEAPGTYHHTLMVGTLAESAADRLGLNSLLVKAGAYYHDVGKLRRPHFFVENQFQGENVHDELSPTLSALIIVSHVREGMDLAAEHGLPRVIRKFITEHHGTTCLGYFHRKAKAMGEELPREQFCYPGPKPNSPETALVMLADSTEAAVRAAGGNIQDVVELEETVGRVIESKLQEKQLDDVAFTLKDLATIKAVFVEVLRSMYHSRQVKEIPKPAETKQEGSA